VDDRYAELVDVLPTLLHVARAEVPPELPGFDLLSDAHRPGGFAEMHGGGYEGLFGESSQRAPTYMWRTRDWKLILHLPGEVIDAILRLDEVQGELYGLLSKKASARRQVAPETRRAIVLWVVQAALGLAGYGLIPGMGSAALYVVRTYLEDKTLIEELPGYEEYAQRTRYRLFPGTW
jgi:arylsulfatase A-like enzyme